MTALDHDFWKSREVWRIQRSVNEPDRELGILTEDGFVVALLGFTGADEQSVARVIAAAPELLEALAALMDITHDLCGPEGELDLDIERANAQARAAIAKARDES